jgi:hypothetical protein
MAYLADVFKMDEVQQQQRVRDCVNDQSLVVDSLDTVVRQADGLAYKLDGSMGMTHKGRCSTSTPAFMTFLASSDDMCRENAEAIVEKYCGTKSDGSQSIYAYGSILSYGIGDTVTSLSVTGTPLGPYITRNVGSGVTPNARIEVLLTDPVLDAKIFRENTWVHPRDETGKSYTLLELFGDSEFLVVDVGANWCGTCLLAQRPVQYTNFSPTTPTMWPFIKSNKVKFVNVVDHLITSNAISSDPTKAWAIWFDGHPEHHLIVDDYDYLHPKCGLHDYYISSGSVGPAVSALYNPQYGYPASASSYIDGPAFPDILYEIFGISPWATSMAILRKTNTHVQFVYQAYNGALSPDFTAARTSNPYDISYTIASLGGGQPSTKDISLLNGNPRWMAIRSLLGQPIEGSMPVPQSPYDNSNDVCGAINDAHCTCKDHGENFTPLWLIAKYQCCS